MNSFINKKASINTNPLTLNKNKKSLTITLNEIGVLLAESKLPDINDFFHDLIDFITDNFYFKDYSHNTSSLSIKIENLSIKEISEYQSDSDYNSEVYLNGICYNERDRTIDSIKNLTRFLLHDFYEYRYTLEAKYHNIIAFLEKKLHFLNYEE